MTKKHAKAHNTTPQRSYNMSCIKGRNNKTTELAMIAILRQYHITGWRRHLPMQGKPDFCFPKQKVIVFVDGCFWHGCPKCHKNPKQNAAFWAEKISKNKSRDKRNSRHLRQQGWSVLRFWEHSLKKSDHIAIAKRILTKLRTRLKR